ncbi:MAG: hypothetical protein IPI67_39200 [Myxococcales bacterium]|nr:hypothetical protein [Myxococcales bacterium]
MSVSLTWHKLSLVQTVKASDGTLSSYKLGSVTVSPTVATQFKGSTIEFEFVHTDAEATNAEPVSLTKILIGL